MTGDRAQYREVGRQVVLLVCGQCGAVVASDATTVHSDWHRGLRGPLTGGGS